LGPQAVTNAKTNNRARDFFMIGFFVFCDKKPKLLKKE
jgi:hypothetical protein